MYEQAECFKALGDETRLRILMMLSDGEKCACDIGESFALKQPTISHHMKVLQQAELVWVEKRGKWMFYGINEQQFRLLNQFLGDHLIRLNGFPYRLAESDCEGTRQSLHIVNALHLSEGVNNE